MADSATTQTNLATQLGTSAPTGDEQVPGSGVELAADSNDGSDCSDESGCSDESDSSERSVTFWETEGMMYDNIESSYLCETIPPRYRWRPGGRRQVHYDRCKPAQLKRFVNDRLLADPFPGGVTLKYFYIRALEKADRGWRFRFMGLPPEMRLLVYRNLLNFQSITHAFACPGKVYPAILRTCKLANTEAKAILYDENVFTILYEADALDHGGTRKIANVHGDVRAAQCGHAKYFYIPKSIDDYPDFFRRVARLEIRLTYMKTGTAHVLGDGFWPLNHYLYALASFLMDGHRLKSVHLKLEMPTDMEDTDYGTILYPLRRLRNVRGLTISGHVPPHVERKLVCDLTSTEPVFNTMRHWKLLSDEATAQFNIHEAMHGGMECMCEGCPMLGNFEELGFHSYSLDEAKLEGCFGSRLEENFIARLSGLRKVLKKAYVADLQELVADLIAKRIAFKRYEAVSDDGRLEEAANLWTGKIYDDAAKYASDDDDWVDRESTDENPEGDGSIAVERTEQQDMDSEHSNVELSSGAAPIAINTDEVDALVEEAINGAAAGSSPEL
ncbi:hypothetical protein LTR37_012254 [Vermiconidia calcicola]|uniref:Uncharacterized protein n=1 Tax=Vermiconidia calcicola TaxID=1690605 RepID=A0ACC3N163_9PEZI|nr:hypothetical protein LTR37_012254 [Vermiconidia calcicola]